MERMTQQENLYMTQKRIPNTLIIVDDSALNRAILHEIFKDTYQIEEAENGMECLEKILDHKEDVCAVLLDIVMPVMNGMELLKILKTQRLTEQIPVFFITAEGSDRVLKEGYDMGVMDIISKPVVPYVLRIHDITKHMLMYTELGAGLSEEQIELISLAAIMHDVGKIAIPDAILNKPGKLTQEEYEIMKMHTIQGAQLLESIPQMKSHEAYRYAYDIARHHHERWDGNGYPDGLKGDEISIWAQIVSVADVYDALVSKRVYKDAFKEEEALQMIQDGKCGVFSPVLLECFFSVEKDLRFLYKH